jgi:hypothetical protein
MHGKYDEIAYSHWPWDGREQSFDDLCAAREVKVILNTENERADLLASLAFVQAPKGRGRTIFTNVTVAGVNLLCGDRITPCLGLPLVTALDSAPLPLDIVLWRATVVPGQSGMISDPVINRCPLFSSTLGTCPDRTLAIDTLHTLNYGPIMRWCSATVWRIILLRCDSVAESTQEGRINLSVRQMRARLLIWYDQNKTPAERRLGELTASMLGSPMGCGTGADSMPHPGCTMKSKAAETHLLAEFALDMLRETPDLSLQEDLVHAGESVLTWSAVSRRSPMILTDPQRKQFVDLMKKHLLNCERANISMVPKHHFFAHASLRLRWMGNPRCYSTFLDESLNMLLRNVMASAHRAHQSWRTLQGFYLIGRLGLSPHIF